MATPATGQKRGRGRPPKAKKSNPVSIKREILEEEIVEDTNGDKPYRAPAISKNLGSREKSKRQSEKVFEER